MSEEPTAVFRRKSSLQSDSGGERQRVIGGIGRRRNTTTNAFQSRLQQFANTGDDNNNGSKSPSSSSGESTTKTLSAAVTPTLHRRSKVCRSDSNVSDSKTPEIVRRRRQNGNDIEKSEEKLLSPTSLLGQRGRRVSVATTTGKEHSQNFVRTRFGEFTTDLAQGNLLQSKNLKWESLSSRTNDAKTKKDSLVIKETSVTPPVLRKVSGETKINSSVNPSFARKSRSVASSRETSPTRERTTGRELPRPQLGLGSRNKTKSATNIFEEVNSLIDNHKSLKNSRIEKDIKSQIAEIAQLKKHSDPNKDVIKRKTPPPVLPRNKSIRKTSSNIMAIQSQLETNFEKPKTTREAEKKAAATRQQLSAITPASSMESVSNQAKLMRKSGSKTKLHDINNNDSDATTGSSTEDKEFSNKNNNSSICISNSKKNNFLRTLESSENITRSRSKSPIRTPLENLVKPEVKQNERKISSENTNASSNVHMETTSGLRKNYRADVPEFIIEDSTEKSFEESKRLFERKLSNQSLKSGFSNKNEAVSRNLKNTTPGLRSKSGMTKKDGFHTPITSNNENCTNGNNKKEGTFNTTDKTFKKPVNDDQNKNSIQSQKFITDKVNGNDDFNRTGVQSIANKFQSERNSADQKESSQQKSQGDHLFSAPTNERIVPDSTFVKQENKKTFDNIHYIGGSNNVTKVKSLDIDNNGSFKKERLPTTARDRSNTWTTSDSDENILDREDIKSDSSYSSSNNKTEERGGVGRRRKLTKKRSKRSKTKPAILKVYERNNLQSFDTSDGDILDSNYTSDDKSRVSSGVESTLCDSDINCDSLDILDGESKQVSYSNTVKENREILKSQSTGNKNNNTADQTLISAKESIQKLTDKINENNLGHGTYLKSSSMTTISGTRIQSLTSFSTTDMGGSRSEDESKLSSFKKSKDDPAIGSLSSISKVSTKVLQSFNSKPLFSPLSKRRTLSAEDGPYSTFYSELSQAQVNNNNSIKPSPFSLSTSCQQFSDGEHELTSRLEKLSNSEDAVAQRSYTLPKPRQHTEFKRTPISLTEIGKPAQDDQSAKEVLNNLPSSPFTLLNRFTRDIQIMQSKSTGSIGKRTNPELIHATEGTNNQRTVSAAYVNGNIEERYITTTDKVPDDINGPLQENSKPLRRSSYLQARDSDDMEDSMSIFQMPKNDPTDEESPSVNDTRSSKRPGKRTRPKLPATMFPEQERDDIIPPLSPIVNEVPDSDSEEDLTIDFKNKVEKVENKRSRQRPPLALPPLLDGIPEEKHGNKKDIETRKRKSRKPVFCEDTITEEPQEPTPETAKLENENDSNSKGSTPKNLSFDEDLSEVEVENKEDDENDNVIIENKKGQEDTNKSWPNNKPNIRNSKSWSELPSDLELPCIQTSSSSMPGLDKSRLPRVSSNERNGFDSPVIPTISTTPTSPIARSVQPIPKKKTPKTELRRYVLQNLLETERSYVQNHLGAMLTMFYIPLKRPESVSIIEPSLVDVIFYQIPDILENHEFFLEQLTNRVNAWSDEQIIADIFTSSFTKCLLMDAYSNFINNFVQAKAAIRQASARPQFRRYVEQCTKEHREKLTLSDLLITPVQRIPRYVLILKDMLKYTPAEHPDFGNLQLALDEIKTLADRMNKGEVEADQAERDIEKLRDIEQTIEGITDLVTSTRKFIRQDLVAEHKGSITKKDRCLFLFSDLLVCTTVRRKNTNFRRGSLGLFTGQSAAELNRYKFVWKYPLDDVEISKLNNTPPNFDNEDIERLDEDVRILNNMLTVAENLSIPHQSLDHYLREIVGEVRNQIQERQNQSPPTATSAVLTKMELQAQVDGITELYTFIFLSAECKSSWEAYFEDAQQKLAYSRDTFPPEFQYPTPITKTRSGMQFTCAAPSYITGFGDANSRALTTGFVWVCNSDGYVGQVCLLSMIPEAQSKASLSVCQSRIACIAVVPGARIVRCKGGGSDMNKISNINDSMIGKKIRPMKQHPYGLKHKKSLPSDMSDDDDDDFDTGAKNIIAFDSSCDEDDIHPSFMGGNGNTFVGGRMSPDGSSLGAEESMEGERDSTDDDYSSDDERDRVDPTRGIPIGGMDDYMNPDLDGQATMWLGTEDGHVHVYNAQDTITQRKSITKRNLGSSITSILNFENKVFIALGRGELCIYKRELGSGAWQLSSPEIIHVSITGSPIACMTAVAGRIWCGCQNTIVLVNATSLKLEPTITVSPDNNRAVHKIVSSGLGVWVTVQSSSTVRLYHATTYENLLDVDVAPAVHKMLAGADAIIRQHKAACLRVTSLLICKDLLWIGTSAGVILTNPLPSITASTSVLRHSIGPTGSPHGHTGHVRFLTSVEVPKATFKSSDYDMKDSSRISPSTNNRIKRKDLLDKSKSMDGSDNNGTVTLVVSGGDGYEDFRYNQQSEAVGRDDSTNHLLIWRV